MEALESAEDIGLKRLSIYGNIPTADLNEFFPAETLLEVVKLAYRKFAEGEPVSVGELAGLAI